jgi:hypothetical protein
MTKYDVGWGRWYYTAGTVQIEAESEGAAQKIMIGQLEDGTQLEEDYGYPRAATLNDVEVLRESED